MSKLSTGVSFVQKPELELPPVKFPKEATKEQKSRIQRAHDRYAKVLKQWYKDNAADADEALFMQAEVHNGTNHYFSIIMDVQREIVKEDKPRKCTRKSHKLGCGGITRCYSCMKWTYHHIGSGHCDSCG